MRIAYSNLIDDATLTESTENTLYPVENVQNQRLAKAWRTNDTVTGIACIVDLGSAQDVDTIAIIGHTITTAATINIEANASDSWGAPSYSTSLTPLTNMILKYLDAAETYRYWRFTVEDASSESVYIDIGRLWLGEYLQIDKPSTTSFNVTKARTDTVTRGRGRQKFATEGVGYRTFKLNFKAHDNAMLTSIQTMYDTVGNHTSVIFSNFDSIRTYPLVEPCYCSIERNIDFRHERNMKFGYSLSLTEDL